MTGDKRIPQKGDSRIAGPADNDVRAGANDPRRVKLEAPSSSSLPLLMGRRSPSRRGRLLFSVKGARYGRPLNGGCLPLAEKCAMDSPMPQRGQPDASRQSRHGVSDVLYLAWLLVLGVAGVASGLGVSRSSNAKVVERFA